MEDHLVLRPLVVADVPDLLTLLSAQSQDYRRFFTPFKFDQATITKILNERKLDLYMGIFWSGKLVCFWLLRGWDSGHKVPTFGVLVDQGFRGHGFEMTALETAKVTCGLRGCGSIMIKTHPDNLSAKGVARKTGFTLMREESVTGNLLYRLDLHPARREDLATKNNRQLPWCNKAVAK